MENIEFEKIVDYIITYGVPILKAILIFIVGSWIIKKITKAFKGLMEKKKYDESLQKFLVRLVGILLQIFLIITVISTLGVETTSLAAVIAAAGLAIGMALQGSLSNFAGGVLIIIFKPYEIGHLIETQGELGHVKEVDIFNTKLITPQNKLAIIPNGAIANGNIVNYTAEGKIRIDITVGIGYGEDLKKAKEVLLEVLTTNPKVLKNPAPSVNVSELADSSVNLVVRPYAKPEDYWSVFFATVEGCKLALDNAGIEIPYPHAVEIHKEA